MKGENNPSKREDVKIKLSKERKKRVLPKPKKIPLRGRTYEEIYGVKKALELKKLRSNRKGIKFLNFTPPKKKECPHCNKLYDPGNLKRHLTRVTAKSEESV